MGDLFHCYNAKFPNLNAYGLVVNLHLRKEVAM